MESLTGVEIFLQLVSLLDEELGRRLQRGERAWHKTDQSEQQASEADQHRHFPWPSQQAASSS